MSIEKRINDLAHEIASDAQMRGAALERELRDIERQKAEIEAKLNATNLALERLVNFQPKIGADYQCPICWIERSIRARLVAVSYLPGVLVGNEDMFRCDICKSSFSIPE